jgi:uncharacterized protein
VTRWPVLVPLLLAAALAPMAQAQEARLLRMGTGSLAGVYFPVGVALCRLVNARRAEHGIRCAATPSEGSVENIDRLRAGEIDLAIVQSDVQDAALEGTGALAGEAFTELRAVMALYPETLTLVARSDAGIGTLADLPGKRLSYGNPGSGQRALWDVVMDRMGWTPATFAAAVELEPVDQPDALCDGQIDAFAYTVGHPALVVQEATTGCDAVLAEARTPEIAELVASEPFYVEATIPGGLYRGNPEPTETFGVGATLVTRADVPQDAVAALVDDVFASIEMLRGLHPALADLDPETMATAGLAAPLHPGAEAFFRERGWIE